MTSLVMATAHPDPVCSPTGSALRGAIPDPKAGRGYRRPISAQPPPVEPGSKDIGTLNEGSLHAGLKEWLWEPGDQLEVPMGEFVIDVVRGNLLIEVQTGSFAAMGRKLDHLLEHHPIRLVHPVAVESWLIREGMSDRRSPKKGDVYSIFDELVSIPTLLDHPNLEIDLVLVIEEQIRAPGAELRRGRGGWHIVDRRLREVIEIHRFATPTDIDALVPDVLDEGFTTSDIARACAISRDRAQRVAYTLRAMGRFEQIGRDRQGIRYRRT
ncbi:MAG: hypothetical protein GY698_03500 [Actinomycetia bacterium]|nr:hypothetical protein [Actinomycetes bacterium]